VFEVVTEKLADLQRFLGEVLDALGSIKGEER
jgi:hypothetical protein